MYDWSPEIQGIILSSINYGSFLAPIPTGYIAGIFGAKYLVGVSLLLSSILALLVPLAADAGAVSLIVLRIAQGIAQVPRSFLSVSGILVPKMTSDSQEWNFFFFQVMVLTSEYSIWVKWAPPLEKNQLINTALSGNRYPKLSAWVRCPRVLCNGLATQARPYPPTTLSPCSKARP